MFFFQKKHLNSSGPSTFWGEGFGHYGGSELAILLFFENLKNAKKSEERTTDLILGWLGSENYAEFLGW